MMIGDVAARSAVKAVALLSHETPDPQWQRAVVRDAQAIIPPGPTDRFITSLTAEASGELTRFLHSPHFDHLATQVMLWRIVDGDESLKSAVREQISWNLSHEVALDPDQIAVATDLLFDLLTMAVIFVIHAMGGPHAVRRHFAAL
jgi:hypothetical protein